MTHTMSPVDRQSALSRMKSEEFDLAIIGGGITGAGVAREAAGRGLKVALVEACDFASGTSSRSSKLIHGGIRYLENYEFGLVFEALSERQLLFETACHLVHPLRFLIPVYKSGRVPAWKLGLGMMAYDALSLFEAPELHQYHSSDELHLEYPELRREDLVGGFSYSDAYMDDDRLVHETMRSAHAWGAQVANYVRAKALRLDNGKAKALICRDEATGSEFELRARHLVASVGPWTDRVGGLLFGKWKPTLRPSKGVHLTFSRARFPLKTAIVMAAEKRIVFAIPRHEMVIVGTTDTDYSQDPSEVRADRQDVQYLIEVTNRYFPGLDIRPTDILACYAGVRPLVDDGSSTESKTSREHAIWTEPHGVTFVSGGKYTTYRKMAEDVVHEVLKSFTRSERARFAQSRSKEPLNPRVTPGLLREAQLQSQNW
ncbi:MAG: glycerol-3-phosphate dehydrogenase/oxidase, partial [Bdellovibrionales bacterium]